ncbi:hypothetical protein CDEF62S_02700 [Castellaniella defragrans]
MDTSDPDISFDGDGVCSHCHNFDEVTSKSWYPNEEGGRRLSEICDRIRRAGAGQEYDCILGLSGGIDSSYLALKIKDYGLRPLVVHVDAGWNSELAVFNIEQITNYCGYDLHTQVIDWEEMRDLQVAYLRSGVANQDVPQDHAFFTSLYRFAVKNRIRYVISGGNIATESVFPSAWHHAAMDADNMLAIHRKFGTRRLKTFPHIGIFQYYLYFPFIYKMKTVRPLNYMPYDKGSALQFLKETIGYKDYGRKHGESVFTKFFQNYYLPKKFGYDKRRPHLSSQIMSGQMSRNDAMRALEEPLYDERELREDMEYVARKLGLSVAELEQLCSGHGRDYSEYDNWDGKYRLVKSAQQFVERIRGRGLRNYS